MADVKTKPNDASPSKFVNAIEDDQKRKDCKLLMKMMKAATGKRPKMWGDSIVGYGSYHYKYKSGREGDWFLIGFSPRKREISLYIMDGFDAHQKLLKKLGKHKTSVCCLYIKRLADVDVDVLEKVIHASAKSMIKNPKTC